MTARPGILAAALAAGAVATVAALAPPPVGAAPASRPSTAPRCPPPPRLVAAPIVSRGRRVTSRPRGGAVVVDGVYRTQATWNGGKPSPEAPSWIAIEIGAGPSRLLLEWTSSGNHDYLDQKYGAPVDYRIETSGDSTDGENGTWSVATSVTDNPARTRAHAFDFTGQRWVRLAVTRLSADVFEWGLYLDELDVHDLSWGGDDAWIFFGDSITSGVFDRAPEHQPSFAEAIARRHPGFFPATLGAGFGSLHHTDAVLRIDRVLALNPQAKVVALSFGSNDWDPIAFRRDLLETIRKVRAAGKIPVVPRVPYRSDSKEDFAARLAVVVDAVTSEECLVPGPDLYSWFRAHPERLADGLHPDAAGSVEMIRLWADAMAPLYGGR